MEDTIAIHCRLGSILKEVWKAYVIMGRWGGSGGGGMYNIAKVFIFYFVGCDVVESEKVGWIGW